ncbi:hypothetical protein TNCV_3955321 [Trichonephila clavipes]|nr:hypothetical protein TNCV_3955321 [Trichonephila clavipes]
MGIHNHRRCHNVVSTANPVLSPEEQASSTFFLLFTMINMLRLKRPSIGVVWKLGEEDVRSQVSPSSLDHGSKSRDSQ